MRLVPIVLVVPLVACGPSREDWWDALATAMCDTRFECEAQASLGYWEDEDACAEEILELVDKDRYDACAYDRSSASDCLSAWNRVECEPLGQQYDDVAWWCDQVWSCP